MTKVIEAELGNSNQGLINDQIPKEVLEQIKPQIEEEQKQIRQEIEEKQKENEEIHEEKQKEIQQLQEDTNKQFEEEAKKIEQETQKILEDEAQKEEEKKKLLDAQNRALQEAENRKESENQWLDRLNQIETNRKNVQNQLLTLNNKKNSAFQEAQNQYVGGLSDAQTTTYLYQTAFSNRKYSFMKQWRIPIVSGKNDGDFMVLAQNQLKQIQQTVRNDTSIFPYLSINDDIIDDTVRSIYDKQNSWLEYYNLLPKGSVVYSIYPLQHANNEGSPFVYGKYILRFFGINQEDILSQNGKNVLPYELNKYVLMGDTINKVGMTIKYNDVSDFISISSRLSQDEVKKSYYDEYEIYNQSTKKFEDHNHISNSLQNTSNNFGNDYKVQNVQVDNSKLIFARGDINQSGGNQSGDSQLRIYQPSKKVQYEYNQDNVISTFKEKGQNDTSQIYLNSNIILQHGNRNRDKNSWKYSFYVDNLSAKCFMYVVVDYTTTNSVIGLQHGSDQLQLSVFNTGGQVSI